MDYDFNKLFKNADAKPYRTGETLIDNGEPGHLMFIVRDGEVGIDVQGEIVERVGPGGIVGEMALLDDGPRSARVVALVDSHVVAVDQRRFLFLIQETPFFAINVMKVMARRLRAMNERQKHHVA